MAQPSAYEQYFLELANAARANPSAEAARLGIGLNDGLSPGTISTAAKQPLAFNPLLIDAARAHSEWMLATDTFSHTGANGSSAGDRMRAAGYSFTGSWTWGENITIAWGSGVGITAAQVRNFADGLFRSAGHRANTLNPAFQEAGIGLAIGEYRGATGVDGTENFARSGSGVFLTGVAYRDGDGDRFYDPGEGLGGLSVQIRSSTGQTWQTTTWDAGGYQIKLAAGEYDVTFSGGGLASPVTKHASIGSSNVKVDLNSAVDTGTPPPPTGQVLVGGAGSQTLVGGAGADTITGGAWKDDLTGGAGVDTFVFQKGDGQDTVRDFQTGVDKVHLLGVTSGQVSTRTTSIGGKSGLLITYSRQGDTVFLEGVSAIGGSDIAFLSAPPGISRTGGSGVDTINGGDGNDNLAGGSGNDTINGGDGYDIIGGGWGADTVTGGPGADTFVFQTTTVGPDIITDFNQLAGDRIDISSLFRTGPFTQADLIAGGFARLTQGTNGLVVQVDGNGGGDNFRTLATLSGVSLSSLNGDILFA